LKIQKKKKMGMRREIYFKQCQYFFTLFFGGGVAMYGIRTLGGVGVDMPLLLVLIISLIYYCILHIFYHKKLI